MAEKINSWLTGYDSKELASILDSDLTSRICLHEWPLSHVERIQTARGDSWICKTQLACAGVERAFYTACHAPLLTELQWAGTVEDCDVLLFPDLGSRIAVWKDDSVAGAEADKLSAMIQPLGNAPVFFDFSTHTALVAALESIGDVLLANGLEPREMSLLQQWVKTGAATCWDAPVGLNHGDLKPENILIGADGRQYLIDWQRPMLAPLGLDTVHAIRLAGGQGDPVLGALDDFITAYWYAWAYLHCLKLPFVGFQAAEYARRCLRTADHQGLA